MMKRKQKRTHILGALIFVALVVIVGSGLVATGNLHTPLNILGGMQNRVGPGTFVTHDAGDNGGPGQGQFGPGRGPERGNPSSGSGPDAENNGGIAWNQIGGVFADIWILSAIVACYILIQQALRLLGNRFWVREHPQPKL